MIVQNDRDGCGSVVQVPCLIRFERCTRQFKHRSIVTVPSVFSTPGAPNAWASSFDTTCSDSRDPGGSFCPQPSQYRPSFFSTAY